jgi:hypothetical protein
MGSWSSPQIKRYDFPAVAGRCGPPNLTLTVQAETALLLDGMDVFGRKIRVNLARGGGGPGIVRSSDPDRVTRTVHIGGFPMEDVNEEQLAEYFSHVGEVSPSALSFGFCRRICSGATAAALAPAAARHGSDTRCGFSQH